MGRQGQLVSSHIIAGVYPIKNRQCLASSSRLTGTWQRCHSSYQSTDYCCMRSPLMVPKMLILDKQSMACRTDNRQTKLIYEKRQFSRVMLMQSATHQLFDNNKKKKLDKYINRHKQKCRQYYAAFFFKGSPDFCPTLQYKFSLEEMVKRELFMFQYQPRRQE